MKTVRPTYLLGGDAVHYLWSLTDLPTDEICSYVENLANLAHHVVALGWGIDMVVGHGAVVSDEEAKALPGERWLPGAGGSGLRVPVPGTLEDLCRRYDGFINRLGPDGFTAPPPLSVYRNVVYRRSTDPAPRPFAAFSLLKLDASGFRAFDATRQALTVAGMLRGASKKAAKKCSREDLIDHFILGHGEEKGSLNHKPVGPQRFAYLPLPTIEARGEGKARVVGSIRRVVITSFGNGCEDKIKWAQRALSGMELMDEKTGELVALLSLIPSNEKIVRHYVQSAAAWSTVTPVVLPGFDDPKHLRRRLDKGVETEEQKRLLERLDERIDGLLRKAIRQAGFSDDLANRAALEWRKVGFLPGVDLADRYGVPDHLKKFPRYHVRVQWRDAHGNPVELPGPICIGGGRFYGVGLFVADRENQ